MPGNKFLSAKLPEEFLCIRNDNSVLGFCCYCFLILPERFSYSSSSATVSTSKRMISFLSSSKCSQLTGTFCK